MASSPRTTARPATVDDVPHAAQVLAEAFRDYRWTRWTVAEDDHTRRLRELHATYLAAVAMPFGRVHVLSTEGGIGAVAVWMPSHAAVPATVQEQVGVAAAELSGDRASAAAAVAEAALAPHRPTIPHISLATLGVSPHLQGRGLGTALLVAGLRSVDAMGLPAYLETSEPGNVRLYERHGFVVTATVYLPDGGPRTWSMVRPPVGG